MKLLMISASSQMGLVRDNNEDMILVRNKFVRDETIQSTVDTAVCDRCAFALCDGMGGHNAGEVASEEVLANLNFFIGDMPEKLSSEAFQDTIVEWFQSVHASINSRGKDDEALRGMGTTFVAIIFYEKKYFWMSCGDSRLYRFRDGVLEQISTDHSLNELTGKKKHSNVLTNCIGAGCVTAYLDINEFTDDVRPGDTYVMCSDGLSDMVDDHHMGQLLSVGSEAPELCHAAIDAGGYDNVSVLVIKVKR